MHHQGRWVGKHSMECDSILCLKGANVGPPFGKANLNHIALASTHRKGIRPLTTITQAKHLVVLQCANTPARQQLDCVQNKLALGLLRPVGGSEGCPGGVGGHWQEVPPDCARLEDIAVVDMHPWRGFQLLTPYHRDGNLPNLSSARSSGVISHDVSRVCARCQPCWVNLHQEVTGAVHEVKVGGVGHPGCRAGHHKLPVEALLVRCCPIVVVKEDWLNFDWDLLSAL